MKLANTLYLLVFLASGSLLAGEGTQWLESQQQSDGSIFTATDVATPFQSSAETLHTFLIVDPAVDPVSLDKQTIYNYLNTSNDDSTETLSRKILILAKGQQSFDELVIQLLQRQNANGGFGHLPGHESTPLETALALEALAEAGRQSLPEIGAAIAFLDREQQSSGAWRLDEDTSIYATALAMRAVWHYRHIYNVTPILDDATSFLLGSRDSDDLWGDTFLSALALIALAPTDARGDLGSGPGNLQARQHADGHFGEDVYQTALALRALRLLEQPLPDEIRLSGRVIDGDTGLPLAGVTLQLSGATTQTATSTADGTFLLSQLNQGLHTLDVTLTGYSSLTTQANLVVGQQSDFGDLTMLPEVAAPTTARLIGTIKDGDSGLVLAGVTVMLAGPQSYETETGDDGTFQIVNIEPGTYSLQASGVGYVSLGAEVTFVAGQTQVFSPEMVPLSNVTVAVFGTVTARDTGLPLEGATVRVEVGGATFTSVTNETGAYSIEGLEAGAMSLQASFDGYLPVTGDVVAAPGNRFDFSPSLQLQGTPPQPGLGGLRGLVLDRATGLGIPNATVRLELPTGNQEVTTGVDGDFSMVDLEPGTGTLVVEITGYRTVSAALSVIADTVLDLGEIPLFPDDYQLTAGITGRVVDTRTDLPLAGVTVDLILPGGTQGFVTTETGTFEFVGLLDNSADLSFFLTGYDSVTLDTLLSPGTIIDLGDIYLRGDDVDNLLPDAAIQALDGSALNVDAQSFALGGQLTVTLVNRGNGPIEVPLRLTAFYDSNLNGVFDPATEPTLGSTLCIGVLAPDATATETLDVSGLLPFRDAPVSVWVDAEEVLVEPSEVNNISSTAALCSNQDKPNIDLAFCLDGSGSVSRSDFSLQLEGTALALENPDIVPRDGSVRITVIQFSSFARVELEPVIIEADNVANVVASIRAIRKLGGGTAIHRGIDSAVSQISAALPVSTQQVIDVSTDGGSSLTAALASVARAQTAGIDTINAIGVGSANIGLLEQIVFPQPAGGDRGFVIDVETFEEYVVALSGKVQQEVKIADLSIGGLQLVDAGFGQPVTLRALVGNGGSGNTPAGIEVVFYDGDPDNGGISLGTTTVDALASGNFTSVEIADLDPATFVSDTLYAVVDPTDALPECVSTNNQVAIPVRTTLGAITLAADESTYPAETDARFTLTVSNVGAVAGDFRAALVIADAAGNTVVRFDDLDPGTLQGGEAINIDQLWNTGTTAVGTYTASALLLDLAGDQVDDASVSFRIISGGGLADISARVTTDRATYGAWDQVLIESLVRNLTSNFALGQHQVDLRVTAPNGSEIFFNQYDLQQLLPGANASYPDSLVLSDAEAGNYIVELEVRDPADGSLKAQAMTSFSVTREAGDSLLGELDVDPSLVVRGEEVWCTELLSNEGSAGVNLNRIRRLVYVDGDTLINEVMEPVTLAAGDGLPDIYLVPTNSLAAGDYVCILAVEVDGEEQTLASASFRVQEPDCGQCSGNTVVLDQSTTIDFTQNPPVLVGDTSLQPYLTYTREGDDPKQWQARLDLEGANLIFGEGVTLEAVAVPFGGGSTTPSLNLDGICSLELPENSAIRLVSQNQASGDLSLNADGDLFLHGAIEQRMEGNWGQTGHLSIHSQCGNVVLGSTGTVYLRGSQEGGGDLTIGARHGDVLIEGLVQASFAHGRSPNIHLEATRGNLEVDGNAFRDLGTPKRGPIFSGVLLDSESTPDMGEINLVAGNNLTVKGYGPNLPWDEASATFLLDLPVDSTQPEPTTVTLTNVPEGVEVTLDVSSQSGSPVAFFGNLLDESLLEALTFSGESLGDKSAINANVVDGIPGYWMSPPGKWDFGLSLVGDQPTVSFVLQAPGLTWSQLTAGQRDGYGLGVIVNQGGNLTRASILSPAMDASQRGTVAIVTNGPQWNRQGGTIRAQALGGDLTVLDWAIDQRNKDNGNALIELDACGQVLLGTTHAAQALAEGGRRVLDNSAPSGNAGNQTVRSSGASVTLEEGAMVLATSNAVEGINDLLACEIVDLRGVLMPEDADPTNDIGMCHNDAPIIDSQPEVTGVVDAAYTYALAITGSGQDGAPAPVALLLDGPTGMSLDRQTQTLHWTPQLDQVGLHNVVVQVFQGCGIANQTFQVEVGPAAKRTFSQIELGKVK